MSFDLFIYFFAAWLAPLGKWLGERLAHVGRSVHAFNLNTVSSAAPEAGSSGRQIEQ
jgi:hypothetical protein